jgi:argininosuccinate synthase
MKARIVCAYWGDAQSAASLATLTGSGDAEIITLSLDLGQGADLEEVRDRALAAGAIRAHVLDVREEFARDYILPALRAGVHHSGEDGDQDTQADALARPLVAKKLAEIAAIEQATVATDASGAHANLWGRVGQTYTWTKSPQEAPDAAAEVEIAFERGIPVAISGIPMGLTELIESLSLIAGHHGVGRLEQPSLCGEAPAVTVLQTAHAALQSTGLMTGSVRLKLLKGNCTVIAHS